MPGWLQALSTINPLRYEIDALRGLLIGTPSNIALDLAVLALACIAGIAASARLLRRLTE
jgi:ABC-2 type transport system permease protein